MINWDQHCWRCFKDKPDDTFVGEVQLKLCRACIYEVRRVVNFLRAHGVSLLLVPAPIGNQEIERDRGGSRGRKGSETNGSDVEVTPSP